MADRILALEGVENFRDYGDYAAGDMHIRPGHLYRSAHHGRATDADVAAMGELGLAVIVDLRRRQERLRELARRPAGFTGVVIENDIGDTPDDPWQTFVKNSDLTGESFRGYLMTYYWNAPHEPRHIDLYSRYFQALATAPGPVLIHCAAGKDRTGILAALTHHLVGVHDDDIVADYMLTNSAARLEARAPLVAEMMAEQTGRTPSLEAVHVALGVDAAYLDQAQKAIRAEHGSIEAYLAGPLGVDAAMKDAIVERLLA
jgi:protein tyrosine/serine phosphatase